MKPTQLIFIALFSLYARIVLSVGSEDEERIVHTTTNVAPPRNSLNLHAHPHVTAHIHSPSPSKDASVRQGATRKRGQRAWTEERRARYEQTIEERRRAVASGSRPKVKGTWTQSQREKFAKTIATRERTEMMRNTSRTRGFAGKKHSEDTKLFISMRKLGVGRLADEDKKRRREAPKVVEQCSKRQRRPYTEAARESQSIAQKERWALVRSYGQRQAANLETSHTGVASLVEGQIDEVQIVDV